MPTTSNDPKGAPTTTATSQLKALDGILHLPRTLRTAGGVLGDSRVNILPKIMFVASVALVLILLLTPEATIETVLGLSGVGDILAAVGLPVDGAIDWLALGLLAINLLKLFPQEIVNEHLDNAKTRGKPTGKVVDADPIR